MIHLFHSISVRKVLPWWNEIDWIRFDCCWRVMDIHGSCSRASGPDIVTFLGDIQEPQDIEILLGGRKARSYTQVLACLTTAVSQWRFMDSIDEYWFLSHNFITLPFHVQQEASCHVSEFYVQHKKWNISKHNQCKVRSLKHTMILLEHYGVMIRKRDTVIQYTLWLDWVVLNDIVGCYGWSLLTVSGNIFPKQVPK